MKEHGFIFQAWGVRAILDAEKWNTRRVVSPHNSTINGPTCPRDIWAELNLGPVWADHGPSPAGNPGPCLKVPFPKTDGFQGLEKNECVYRVYPRYQVGDNIWVKETWRLIAHGVEMGGKRRSFAVVAYRADDSIHRLYMEGAAKAAMLKMWRKQIQVPSGSTRWRSPMMMPRWAARLVLPINDLAAERVQDITQAGAVAEGMRVDKSGYWLGARHTVKGTPKAMPHPVAAFRDIWEDIHGPGAWERNDLVWVPTWKPMGRAA